MTRVPIQATAWRPRLNQLRFMIVLFPVLRARLASVGTCCACWLSLPMGPHSLTVLEAASGSWRECIIDFLGLEKQKFIASLPLDMVIELSTPAGRHSQKPQRR